MATTVQTIINAAVKSSVANDDGNSPIASDANEVIAVVDRKVKQIYALAAIPRSKGGSRPTRFLISTTVALSTPATTDAVITYAPECAFVEGVFITSSNTQCAIVSLRDVLDGLAELAPAVILTGNKVRSPGRTGDPAAAAGLTIYYSYLPGTLANLTDYIGATTPATASTSQWPGAVGDPFLVNYLGLYFAMKDGTRTPAEIQNYQAEVEASAQALASYLDIDATSLVSTQE